MRETHMKAALEFSITPQLHEDDLVNEKTNQVERLRDRISLISCVGHGLGWSVRVRVMRK